MDATTTTEVETAKAAQLAALQGLDERLRDYHLHSRAPNTIRGYASDLKDFTEWCQSFGFASLPAEASTIALYVTARAETWKPATISRHLAAIAQLHEVAGFDSPTRSQQVVKALAGIRREKGVASATKTPLTVADLQAIVGAQLPAGTKRTRDHALLLIGMAGAFRRSELVGIDVEHIAFEDAGVVITLRTSKTDQEGVGRIVGIAHGNHAATCPVRALREWIAAANITTGPVFRPVNRHGQVADARLSPKAVALVVKEYTAAIGRDADAYSGHSLRAGHVTAAARAGVPSRDIMEQTGHKSEAMMRRYVRRETVFDNNSSAALGL